MGEFLSPGFLGFLMTSKIGPSGLFLGVEEAEAFSYSAMRLRERGRGGLSRLMADCRSSAPGLGGEPGEDMASSWSPSPYCVVDAT